MSVRCPQSSFLTWIVNPAAMGATDQPVRVEVTYQVRDVGVMMKTRENVRAIPVKVTYVADETNDILPQLCWDTYTQLRMEAEEHNHAEWERAQEDRADAAAEIKKGAL